MKEDMIYINCQRQKAHLDNPYNKQPDEDTIYSPNFVEEKTKAQRVMDPVQDHTNLKR